MSNTLEPQQQLQIRTVPAQTRAASPMDVIQLSAALDSIGEDIEKASSAFEEHSYRGDPWVLAEAGWLLKLAYSKLLLISEVVHLPMLRGDVAAIFAAAQENITASDCDPDDNPHLKWAGHARRFHQALQSVFVTEPSQTVTKDLEALIRESVYVIADEGIYGSVPQDESDVHRRIEGMLRCVFPDLLTKPPLSKPIKNFEPDTGIPSIRTIIEYKFVRERTQVGTIADQILADTRGYTSDRYDRFLYVVYETERFQPEVKWRQLLRDCGTTENTTVIVLNGTSIAERQSKDRGRKRAKRPTPK